MSGGSVLWAEAPDDDGEETPEPQAAGHVDESFATRRLRRWIKGMFGGKPPAAGGEAARPGEPEGSPGNDQA